LDPADDFLAFVEQVSADPAGAIQELNGVIASILGFTAPSVSFGGTTNAQTLTINNVTDGTFTLSIGGETTEAITFGPDAASREAAIKSALEAIVAGTVTVTQTSSGAAGDGVPDNVAFTVDFGTDPGVSLTGNVGKLISLNILSLDPDDLSIVNIDFGLNFEKTLSQPFDLDLSDIDDLPNFLTNLVGIDASGTLFLGAEFDLDLGFGIDLSGPDKGVFIRTDATHVMATATASGADLEFGATLGPHGIFVIGGMASLDGAIRLVLDDPDDDQRLELLRFDGGPSDLGRLGEFFGTAPVATTCAATPDNASYFCLGGMAKLPLFVGTADNPAPIDFATATPGTNNAIELTLDAIEVLNGTADDDTGIVFTLPAGFVSFFSTLEIPSIFALLADPSVVVGGLDRLLLTLQEALNGQVLGVELPFIGDALKDNPVANFIGDFRDDILTPLAKTIRENNLNLEGLTELIRDVLFNVLSDSLSLLKDLDGDGDVTRDDIQIKFLNQGGEETNNVLLAQALQFDLDLGKKVEVPTPDIKFDLGIPGLGIEADLTPIVTIDFNLHLGFGIHVNDGFYFVTDYGSPDDSDLTNDELSLELTVAFPTGTEIKGTLGFLALTLTNGIDTDGSLSELRLAGGIDVVDPTTPYDAGNVASKRLTFSEMTSGSISAIFKPGLTGSAQLRLDAEIDFGGLDPSLANVLPSVSTKIVADFSMSATPDAGFVIAPPSVAFLDITLDLGSFISDFAGPILETVGDILSPLDWLIGRDGFLNKRIPLLSDIAGKTITGKDLIVTFDPKNGPKVVAFLDAVEQILFLVDLVADAAAEANGGIMVNFGDLVRQRCPRRRADRRQDRDTEPRRSARAEEPQERQAADRSRLRRYTSSRGFEDQELHQRRNQTGQCQLPNPQAR
jgi:hypothetical protein